MRSTPACATGERRGVGSVSERAPILRIEGLHVRLPAGADRPYAVEDANLELHPGETLCVVGESGSGKSLTARAVLGLLPAPHVVVSAGRIVFAGQDLLQVPADELRRVRGAGIAMVFQEPMSALNPLMTIGAQIEEVLQVHGALAPRERGACVLALLEDVHLPDPARIARAYPHQISGGQRQRAMIAMALILEPKVLIADEPTTALDVTTQAQILRLVRELQQKRGTAVLFITHDFGVVADIADRVAVMRHGRVVETGTAEHVLTQPEHPYTRALIAAVPPLAPPARQPAPPAPDCLAVSGLSKSFQVGGGWLGGQRKAVQAVRDVGFRLKRGETLGIVGESGSGKSTVARCLVRLVEPDAGEIALGGVDLVPLPARRLRPLRKRIQMVFQDPFGSLNPRYRVGRIIAEGPIVNGVPNHAAFARARELLELVGLDARAADRFPHEFSGGQRQRIGIARALALEPEVLVADEPVSALDVSVQAQVLELLASIRDRLQLSMVFITHDLRVAAQVCDRIAVMQRGEVVEYGPTTAVFASPSHPYTRELMDSIPGRAWSHGATSAALVQTGPATPA
ncbi:MAG: ABC transporter ATP-binding protein [Betaproteobacteria bacterium]|nr:ABC transporter ATP-binding protein [Betaproteobacteria bacterium]